MRQHQFALPSVELQHVRGDLDFDHTAVFLQVPPDARLIEAPCGQLAQILVKARQILGRANVLDRHGEEFVPRIAVVADCRIVHGQEAQCRELKDPHGVRVRMKEMAVEGVALAQFRLGALDPANGQDKDQGQHRGDRQSCQQRDNGTMARFGLCRARRHQLFQPLLVVPHPLFETASGGDVMNHRQQQRTSIEFEGMGIHLDGTELATRQSMAEDEVVAVFLFGKGALGRHQLRAEGVDLRDGHGPQCIASVTIEVRRGRVGIDDLPGGRVDQQHHDAVIVEHLAEIGHLCEQGGGNQRQPQRGEDVTQGDGRRARGARPRRRPPGAPIFHGGGCGDVGCARRHHGTQAAVSL